MFNFERDHAEIDEELEEPNESGYVREFYMRFTTRGIYPADLQGKSHFRTIEEDLNAKITLKEIVANTILNSNNENYIKYAIDNAPIDTYHTFLKCAIYTLNDFAVQYLVEHWPFESLELIRYFQDAYSSLLMFYCTDISSYTGRIASQVHKWILIGDKYVKMVTKIFIRQRHKEGVKLCKLDISGLPVSARLFTKLVDIYYKHVYNHESLFKQPNILQKTNDEKEKADEAPRMSKAAAAAVAAAASAISALAAAKRRKKNSEDEDEDENMTSSGDSGQNRDNSSDDVKDDDEDEDEDEDDDENNRDEFINCIRKTFFNDVDESDESSDIEENEDEDEDQDESESLESESEFESDSDANSLPSLENISDVEMKEESTDKKDDKKEKAVNKASNDNEKEESGEKNSPKKKNGGEKRLFNIKSPKIIIRAPRVFKPNTVKQTIRLDFEETYSCDFARFAGCIDYMNKVNLNPDELMFNLNIARLNMTIQNAAEYQIKPSFERVAKRVIGLSLFFMARPVEIKHTFSIIKHFPNITELNVSAFGSEQQLKTAIAQNPSIRDELYESLSSLVHLKRLRLNALEITGHVRRLLGSLKLPLEYLNLTSCRLDPDDLEYLAESSHASSVRVLILSNDDLEKNVPLVKNLLVKCSRNLEVLDMGCNTFSYEDYMTLIWEISKMPRLKMLVTLNLFTFDNYLKIADKLNEARSFMAWRLNFSTDYYQQSVKIRSKFKFKKFKSDYLKSLQNKFDSRPVKITINDPDLNFILHEVL